MGAGSKLDVLEVLEVLEEADGVKLRVVRSVPKSEIAQLAGMVQAPRRGTPSRLQDFDAASLLTKTAPGEP